jgi:hypothetical protein
MVIVTLGIDLAKNVFALHGVDATGRAVLVRPSVARAKLLELVAAVARCLIGMEEFSRDGLGILGGDGVGRERAQLRWHSGRLRRGLPSAANKGGAKRRLAARGGHSRKKGLSRRSPGRRARHAARRVPSSSAVR